MTLTTSLIAYVATLIAFFILDMIWLGGVAKSMYANALGDLLADSPRWGVAIGFYCLFIVGVVFFAVRPGLASDTPVKTAALLGAALGALCYATYDLTSLAVIRDFPSRIVVIDIIWGAVLTGSCAAIGTFAALKLG